MKELHTTFPDILDFKNGLAVSYSKLGDTQSSLGNLDKALGYFEERHKLGKELYDSYPNNVEFKFHYGSSLITLGQTHNQISLRRKNRLYFEEAYQIFTELYAQTKIPKYYQKKRELEMMLSLNSGCFFILTVIANIIKPLVKIPFIKKFLGKWVKEAKKEILKEYKNPY